MHIMYMQIARYMHINVMRKKQYIYLIEPILNIQFTIEVNWRLLYTENYINDTVE